MRKLVAFGIVPVCGARWPGAPLTPDSLCAQRRILTDQKLHLDHTPPLTDAERKDRRAVCDPLRVQLLCETCHNAKTQREQRH